MLIVSSLGRTVVVRQSDLFHFLTVSLRSQDLLNSVWYIDFLVSGEQFLCGQMPCVCDSALRSVGGLYHKTGIRIVTCIAVIKPGKCHRRFK